ncbi:hypothetical protein [Actinoplanes sp. NPDC049316]|uniref:hypothetical protein n=1 Tax=Actinoplanes sp. NPDC049316 TaxID=3154727 RepID=UPI0034420B05
MTALGHHPRVATDALAPVRHALMRRAQAEAGRLRADAEADAARRTGAARARAEEIRGEARRAGSGSAEAAGATIVAAAGRDARRLVLTARREAYEALRADVRERVAAMVGDPAQCPAFRARIRTLLGPGAEMEAMPGGLAGTAGDVRVECTVDGLTDAALAALGSAPEEMWQP